MESTRILVAEDNPVNQKVAELMLRRMGYTAEIAPNGKIAIEKLQAEHYPLVLMDAQMPVLDGISATDWIRKNIPASQQPKIIVMTASLMEDAKTSWKSVEVDGFIEKPVRVEVLKQTILDVIEIIPKRIQ